MPRKLRCPRPINPILMMGRRGHQLFQRISNNVCAVAGARNIGGGGPGPAPSVADFIAYAADNGGVLKGLVKGVGSFAFARATEASVTDFEGLVKTALVNELRFEFGRRVENVHGRSSYNSENINDGSWVGITGATITGANTFTFVTGGNPQIDAGSLSKRVPLPSTLKARATFDISCDVTVDVRVNFRSATDFIPASTVEVTGGAGTQRLSFINPTDFTTNEDKWIAVQLVAPSQSGTVTINRIQFEDVTGQANQNPSEYVSVGVGTGSELNTVAAVFAGSGWVDNGDGTYTHTGTTTGECWLANDLLVDNKKYVISFTSVDGNIDTLQAGGPGGETAFGIFPGDHTYELVSNGTDVVNAIRFITNDNNVTISNISIKEADHGVNVDGVKCFNYANNNSVGPGGVVTESKGATFSTVPRALYEPAATNLSNTNDDLTGGAETVTIAATGNHTLSVGGSAAVTVAAGTATGTGFGQATEGSPVTFNITGTGTVTLTLNSGTLGTADKGYVLKQVEVGAIATSFVESPGGGGTRTADDGSPSFDFANWSQEEGTWYTDFWNSSFVSEARHVFGMANSPTQGLYLFGPGLNVSDDSGASSRIISPANINEQYRYLTDFSTGGPLEAGFNHKEGAGTWQWDNAPANYSGAFNITANAINIAYNTSVPVRLRGFTGYTVSKGREWVEDNL